MKRLGFLLSGILETITNLPDQLSQIINNAIAYFCIACFSAGVIISILGTIKWATGWDEKKGKKTIVKGVILIGASLLLGGLGFGMASFFPF